MCLLPCERDPGCTDHFLSDRPDKFDICFMKGSEAAQKICPLGLVKSRQVCLLMSQLVDSDAKEHAD